MKKFFFVILFILLCLLGACYLYYLRPIVDDELYNFGFSNAILNGEVPYLDFNLIIPPLFPYLFSLVLMIFGKKLLVYHLFLAFMATSITYLSFKKIGISAIALYALLLTYPYTGYNVFCLFIFFVLLYINDCEFKYRELLEGFLICCLFLTKQTLGLLVIPSLLFSKKKKKLLLLYFVAILLLLIYLLLFNNLSEFINYTILGMFDFTAKNSDFSLLFYVEIVNIIILLFYSFRKKSKIASYLLCFQIIVFPIVNHIHFLIGFLPILYYLFVRVKKNNIMTLFLIAFSINFFIIFSFSIYFSNDKYVFLSHYSENTFMKGRLCYTATNSYVSNIQNFLSQYEEYDAYLLGNFTYLVKLNLDMPLNKYDIINNGNMGYHGSERYISEISSHCEQHKCVFIINDEEASGKIGNQVNRDILLYVQKYYYKVYSSNLFSVYIVK